MTSIGRAAAEVSPCGASFFPSDGKETKGSPGETHIAVGNKFPPAPVRSPPDPRNLRGPNSRGLPVTVRRGRDNDCPRNRAAAAVGPKSRRPGQLDQTGAPDSSGSNLCGGELAGGSGIRPYGAISVIRNTMTAAAMKPRLSLRNQTGPRKRRRGESQTRPSPTHGKGSVRCSLDPAPPSTAGRNQARKAEPY